MIQGLRPYQIDAKHAALDAMDVHGSALLVAATGLGKSVILASIIAEYTRKGRVMVLAHREELIRQLAATIEAVAGVKPEIEMASQYADMNKFRRSDVVVSTVQTQRTRMSRFKPDQFSLVVVDEAHRGISEGYTKVVNHYRKNERLHVLGVTATPKRTDKAALVRVFASCPFVCGIRDAVRDGWLVPVRQKFVVIRDLDFEPIKTVGGDFNPAELEEAMMWAKPLHEVVSSTIQTAGDRKTIVFCVSVRHAERLCEAFNEHRKDSAHVITGETPTEKRKELLAAYKRGEFQYLLNVAVFTEGFDEPGIEVVVMARPTKSELVYLQQLGRGTRPLPGAVDGLDSAQDRHLAIASSPKPYMTVLDFVGNAGRHKLISSLDALAGSDNAKVLDMAKKRAMAEGEVDAMEIVDKSQADMDRALDEARAAEIARRARLRGHATYSLTDVGGIEMELPADKRERWKLDGPASEKQVERLKKWGVPDAEQKSYGQAQREIIRRAKSNAKRPATDAQKWRLKKEGKWRDGMTLSEASKAIGALGK